LLYDPNLYAIEPNAGTIIWSADLGEYSDADGWSEPALGPDGTVYVSLDDPYLRAVDPNGNIKWVICLGRMGGFTLTISGDGIIYAAGDDGYIYVVDTNGQEIARFQSDAWLNFPVIVADNTIVVSDAEDYSMLITDATNTVWAITRYGCEDLNADETVNFIDLALLSADWLECTDPDWPCSYVGQQQYVASDIDRDKYVRFSDIAAIGDRWLDDVGWLKPPPCMASNPNPTDGATGVTTTPVLHWTACQDATWHDVYFGTDWRSVANATTTWWGIYRARQTFYDTYFYPFFPQSRSRPSSGALEWGKTYYWRIDEVSDAGIITIGTVWRFTTRIGQ